MELIRSLRVQTQCKATAALEALKCETVGASKSLVKKVSGA